MSQPVRQIRLTVYPEGQLIATLTGWHILQDLAVDAELANRLLPAVIAAQCGERSHWCGARPDAHALCRATP